jgi:diacylglycerol kinase family enzyme
MSYFKHIVVIYNPNSSGDSKANAERFAQVLSKRMPDCSIRLQPTKYAGHAEKIAAEHAPQQHWLLVSSSGDGGYNEVINGVLSVRNAKATVCVLPSGNANDHHAAVSSDNILSHIATGKVDRIDVLKLKSSKSGKPWKRYAHSYVGFGLTPSIGKALTQQRPNIFTEKFLVLRHILTFKHVTLRIDGILRRYVSLVFATVPRMAKVVQLSEAASLRDGQMEIYQNRYDSAWGLTKQLVRALSTTQVPSERTDSFIISTTARTLVQLDGEVFTLDANSKISITCEKRALRTVS